MSDRCGAEPAALMAFGVGAGDREARLLHAAACLHQASDSLPLGASAAAQLADVSQLLVRLARDGRELDERVAQVGQAFLDAGAPTGGQVLAIDERGDGRLVVAFGDLARARHVAVLVPGVGTTIANAPGTVGRDAAALYAAAHALDEHVAVIAWLGYDPPDWLGALQGGAAARGAADLAAFVRTLRDRPERHITVIGHSYGSVVVGDALRRGLAADDVVVTGSPGMDVDSVDALPGMAGHVYAERAPLDVVGLSEAYGRDPTDPRFGAIRLATGDDRRPVSGHSSYFDDGTVALANIAAVVTGQPARAVAQPPTPFEQAAATVDDVWEHSVEMPVDAAQDAIDAVDTALDATEASVPSGPWSGAVATLHDVQETTVEQAQRTIDLVQRAASPDFAADLVGDALELFG